MVHSTEIASCSTVAKALQATCALRAATCSSLISSCIAQHDTGLQVRGCRCFSTLVCHVHGAVVSHRSTACNVCAAVLCCCREKNLEKALKEAKVKARRWATDIASEHFLGLGCQPGQPGHLGCLKQSIVPGSNQGWVATCCLKYPPADSAAPPIDCPAVWEGV